jgi:DNA-binding protein WhiA
MTFSEETRNELARSLPSRECCRRALLSALLYSESRTMRNRPDARWVLSTTCAPEARLILKLLKETGGLSSYWEVKRDRFTKQPLYLIFVPHQEKAGEILSSLGVVDSAGRVRHRVPAAFSRRTCCRRSYLKGAFLSGGSITAPRRGYHLEIYSRNEEYSRALQVLAGRLSLSLSRGRRRGAFLVYSKKSEEISLFLNILGSYQALLRFEEVRAIKETVNDVHRLVNCETANLQKLTGASIRQVNRIEFLKSAVGLKMLPPALREIARARLKYRSSSIREIGERFSPPLSKSSVQHRLARLEEMAEKEMKKIRTAGN